jgi:transposase
MRGRRLQIPWQEDAEQLRQLYHQEHDPELRPRLHALWLLRQGQSLRDTAALLDVHYVTAQQWIAWYRQGGVAEVRRHKRGNATGMPPRLTAEQLAAIRAAASAGTFHTAQDLTTWVREHLGVTYTRWGIYSLLRRHGYKAKVPRPISARTTPEEQEAWKKGG